MEFVVIFILAVIGYFLYTKFSAKKTLQRAVRNAEDSVRTEDDVYRAMVSCIVLNGDQFKTIEEIEADLESRAQSINELEKLGMPDNRYKELSEISKKIYLILNGYDLTLLPLYLQKKAISFTCK